MASPDSKWPAPAISTPASTAPRQFAWWRAPRASVPPQVSTALVEHTSINPNKAAHIGHLRNAILGDTFVRLLRAAGQKVDVQNYIDNTGVQVADVVVGFLHLEGKSAAEVRALIARTAKMRSRRTSAAAARTSATFDYYCWDLYARTSQWYGEGTDEEKAARKKLRLDTLHCNRSRRQRNRRNRRPHLHGRPAPPS